MEVQTEATRRRTCATYVGDMHALEWHLLEAFERQLAITKELPDAHALVQSLIATSKRHTKILNELVSSLGDVEKIVTDKLKSAVAGLFGIAAGLVDTVRPLAVSKALRDNYTAINHAIVGYVMLSTTAGALKNAETKLVAYEFLNDWIGLAQELMRLIPTLALKDLSDIGIKVLDFNAARDFATNEKWGGLFGTESSVSLPEVISELQSILEQQTLLEKEERAELEHIPNRIVLEKRSASETLVHGHIEKPLVETIVKPVIVQETFRPEKIIEVQPVIHREVQAPEIHHIERHVYEKIEATGSHVVTNKPIVNEVIRPHIIEEVQEIIHRELPAPYVEKVQEHLTETEILPTLHTKEVLVGKEEVFEADLVVEESQENTEELLADAMAEVEAEVAAIAEAEAELEGELEAKTEELAESVAENFVEKLQRATAALEAPQQKEKVFPAGGTPVGLAAALPKQSL